MLNKGSSTDLDKAALSATDRLTASWEDLLRAEGASGANIPSAAAMLDLIPAIIWSARPDGVIDYVNQFWYEVSGRGHPSEWMSNIHPHDYDKTARDMKEGFAGGVSFEVQHRYLYADGVYRWMLGRARPMIGQDGQVLRWVGTCTDIEEKKAARDRLEENELIFKFSSLATRNVLWSRDLLRNVTTYSQSLTTELGYEINEDVTAANWWTDHIHPDDREQIFKIIGTAIEKREPTVAGEYRFKLADGSFRRYFDRCTLLYDESGNLIRMIGAMDDVTEERQATAKLKESEQLWRSLTNTMSQIAWMSDAHGKFLWFNDRWYEFSAQSEQATVDHAYLDSIHPDYQSLVKLNFARALKSGESWDETVPMRGKEGEYRWFLTTAHPIRSEDGNILRWLGTNTDITRQLVLTDRIKEREEQLRMATEAAKLGTWNYEIATDILEWNEQAAVIFGTPGRLRMDKVEVMTFVHPDDRVRVREELGQMIKSTTMEFTETEFKIVRPDGTVRWISCVAKQLEQLNPHDGHRLMIVGTYMDLTDRINAEIELKKAKEAAEMASAAKTAFLANMSHEIRTPLGAILGFTDLLKDPRYSPSERGRFIETISRAGSSLTRIIDDILDLSKIEAGHIKLEFTNFSLVKLIRDCLSLYSEIARAKGIQLDFVQASGTPDVIYSDATRIRQILINLIGNAVKFTKEGSVRIELSFARDWHGNKDPNPESLGLCIQVKDTGIGISSEHHKRIFQPFTQVDDSTTRNYGGTGLGLALSKRLALALEGDISILDRTDCSEAGCTFSFVFLTTLPSKDIEPENGQISLEHTPIDLSAVKILVAEDSPEIQFLLHSILGDAGADVSLVNNGLEAIQAAEKQDFDIILMDIQMPITDGYEATRVIRAAGFEKTIIAVTAHAMEEERERTRAAGCNYHLTKPLHPVQLLETIDRCVRNDRKKM
jgi:PAS domain S-box-containing protein